MLDSYFAHIDSVLSAHVCHECVPVMTDAQLCEVLGKVWIRRCQSVCVYVL